MKTVKNSTALLLTLLALVGVSTLSSCSEYDDSISPFQKEAVATGEGGNDDPPCTSCND
ncbi:MAG: hypothetical protein RIF33_21960 [Cyclobacteriaceae bacterium]